MFRPWSWHPELFDWKPWGSASALDVGPNYAPNLFIASKLKKCILMCAYSILYILCYIICDMYTYICIYIYIYVLASLQGLLAC